MERKLIKLLFLGSLAGLFAILTACTVEAQTFDWKSNWEVEEGFSIDIDSEGYTFPTAIVFVPEPGNGPRDPLYFVTELGGNIKVVTNDRTVETFADAFIQFESPLISAEDASGQAGVAGICLDPEHGYVFVTFTYRLPDKTLRNNIIRFQSQPGSFSAKPTSQIDFGEVFLAHRTGPSHQIGPCQVKDDLLYVSVGDGGNTPQKSLQLDSLLGKIIRMTLDGNPVPENPFYVDDDLSKATNFVWAYGFRNPFGLKTVNDRFFVADNGMRIDRFLEIEEGESYLWDASDWSIGARADFILAPSHGVVQLDRYPEGSTVFPEPYSRHFFLALSGNLSEQSKWPGILAIEYDLEDEKILSPPRTFLRYTGPGDQQVVSGLAFGPDGIYAVPVLPIEEGLSAVLKITYAPSNQHPFTLSQNQAPRETGGNFLMFQKGCTGCHMVSETVFGGRGGGTEGPTLEVDALVPRLMERLHSEEYVRSLEEIDQLESEPFVSFKEAREAVLAAQGVDRVRVWVKYRIQEPRFDNVYSRMPNLGITESESEIIADFLITEDETGTLERIAAPLLPERARRVHLVIYFAGGVFLGMAFLAISYLILRRLHWILRSLKLRS